MRNTVPEVCTNFFILVVAQQVSNLDCCQRERHLRQGVPTQLTPICFQAFGVLTNKMPINWSHLGSASVLAPSSWGFSILLSSTGCAENSTWSKSLSLQLLRLFWHVSFWAFLTPSALHNLFPPFLSSSSHTFSTGNSCPAMVPTVLHGKTTFLNFHNSKYVLLIYVFSNICFQIKFK